MALIDSVATHGDELENRFKSRKGAWFDWTMDEEEPEEKDESSINWADPRAWQDARKKPSDKHKESKVPAQTAGKQESAETSDASDAVSTAPVRKSENSKKRSKKSADTKRVVWCHEHCHKSQNDVWRKTLWRTCREHEASLVCHKKAAKFEAWLSSAAQPNYILIADWREAKPCMEVMLKGFRYTQMIVYCETENTFRKASEWASNLPQLAGPVCVMNGMDEVNAYLLELFSEELKPETEVEKVEDDDESHEVCPTPSTMSECEEEAQANGLDTDTTDHSEDEAMQSHAGAFFTPKADQVWVPCVRMISPMIQVVVPVVAPVAAPAVDPIAHVLGPVLSSYTAQDLSLALAEAMPDSYTD